MEIFNIGPLELIGILLIMFFLLGPKGMILTAQKIGAWIRKMVKSPVWQEIMGYSQDIRELPKKIMDDTGLKEALDDVQKTTKETAAELNATVNEAVQSARVPEAEHVRLDTTPVAGPDNRKTYPVAETGKEQIIAPPAVGAMVGEVSDSSAEIPSPDAVEGTPGTELETESAAFAENSAGVIVPAAVEKKPRRRVKAQEPLQETAADTPANEEKQGVPKRARSRKAAVVTEEPVVSEAKLVESNLAVIVEPVAEVSPAEATAPLAEPVTDAEIVKPVRKPRKTRKETSPLVDTPTHEETRVFVELADPVEPQADLQPPVPPRQRKPRARKDNGASPVLETAVDQPPAVMTGRGSVEDTSASPGPEVFETAVIEEEPLPQETPASNADRQLPARKPRRPRPVKQAPDNPTAE